MERKRNGRWKRFLLAMTLCFIMSASEVRGETGTEVFKFTKTEEYIVNPDMGPVATARNRTRVVDGSLVLGAFTWRDIEEKKGVYDFTRMEAEHNYSYWTEEKKNKFMFGLSMDVPDIGETLDLENIDIPRWLYEEMKKEGIEKYKKLISDSRTPETQATYESALWKLEHDDIVLDEFNLETSKTEDLPEVGTFYRYYIEIPGGREWRCGFSPNYESPLMIRYHDLLLKKLAERYDNEKTYAFVMGSLGHWGEMHTFFVTDPKSAGKYPPKRIAEQYEQSYAENFKKINISARYPRRVAKEHNFGLHSHAFGDYDNIYKWHIDFYEKGYTDSSTGDFHPEMKEFWKKAPSGGEFLYTGDGRFLRNDRIAETLKQAKDTKLTWFNELWYGLNEEERNNQEVFFSKIGYRLFPEKVTFTKKTGRGKAVKISSVWKNGGTAPFYKNWKLYGILKNEKGEDCLRLPFGKLLSGLMPGTSMTVRTKSLIPKKMKPGSYKLYIGIVNPLTKKAEIRLAVKEKEENGLYFVGKMEIGK